MKKKENKSHPIQRRVMAVLMLLCAGALIFTGLLWLGSLIRVRNQVALDSEELGDTAYSISALSMRELAEKNYVVTAQNRAQTIDATLARYLGYVGDFAFYVHRLYEDPDAYLPKEVLPPDARKAYQYTMQLSYADESVDKEAVAGEVGLLANVEHVWQPVMESQRSQIGSIYLCTESGFMINYDERSDLAKDYFDFFQAKWYTTPKETGRTILTDAYMDSFGRGLMVTCATPLYDAKGSFAGVMCIDLLISDLEKILSTVDLGDGSFAYLVDGEGRVLISPNRPQAAESDSLTIIGDGDGNLIEHIRSGESGGEYGGTDDDMFFAYSPITSAEWMLVFEIPAELIRDPSMQAVAAIEDKTASTIRGIRHRIWMTLLLNIGVIFLVHIVVAVISRLFSKQLTGPLLELQKDAAIISGGNLDHRAEICEIDEIGDLAHSFNDMAASLDEHIKDLTRVTAERERIGAELDVARHIQASMLPCIFPPFPDREEFEIYATMDPAKEVGGDFYDLFMVDQRHLAVVMADVSGKGVPAALFMVIGKTLIKDHTEPDTDLGDVFTQVNDLLCASNSEGLFITAFEGVLDLVTGEFQFVNAGHEMPFIFHEETGYEVYKIRPGFVLAGMEQIRYRSGSMTLKPGDKIFLYTDGVTEATDKDNQLYGMKRLEEILNENAGQTPTKLLSAIRAGLDAFVGDAPQFDDITMLSLEFRKYMEEK